MFVYTIRENFDCVWRRRLAQFAVVATSARSREGRERFMSEDHEESIDAWFVNSVTPYERVLDHFIRCNWSNPDDLPDIRQEVYARVFESAKKERPKYIKSYMIQVARNLIIDRVRRLQLCISKRYGS